MFNRYVMTFGAACALLVVSGANAGVVGAVEVEIPGTANIFGAGLATPPAPGGGGGGTLPVLIELPAFRSGEYFSMSAVFGSVSCCSGAGGTFNGPDGGSAAGGSTNVQSEGNISGLIHSSSTMFLAGVFITAADPTTGGAPPRLDFSDGNDNLPEYSPLLNQSFFIGDGLFNEDQTRHLEAQKFYIPAGATHLALGFVDSFNFTGQPGFYDDNRGSLTAVVGFVPAPGAAGALAMTGVMALRRRR
jgi:hypothetical protein